MDSQTKSDSVNINKETLPDPPDIISRTARDTFGISGLFPFQRLVISNILEGCGFFGEHIQMESFRNQIVILPTGSGKSLCFSLPGVLLDSITLIIFPLLSLISDQARRLQDAGITNGKLVGGQSKEERAVLWEKLAAGEISFLLTNPESLQKESVLKQLMELHFGHAVIDEAHIVSDWGMTFRPSYLEIGNVLNKLDIGQITAFTATAVRTTIDHIKTHVFYGNPGWIDPLSYSAEPGKEPSRLLSGFVFGFRKTRSSTIMPDSQKMSVRWLKIGSLLRKRGYCVQLRLTEWV